jgi:hypothetical protein
MVRGKGADEPSPNRTLMWVDTCCVSACKNMLTIWISFVFFETITKRAISTPIDIAWNNMTVAKMTSYLGKAVVKTVTNPSAPPKARTVSPAVTVGFAMLIISFVCWSVKVTVYPGAS